MERAAGIDQDEVLAELAALGLALARDLQARALAAKDDQAACDLALAFHRVSRSLRQTLALQLRLQRDRKHALREDARNDVHDRRERVVTRKSQVRAALSRLIWTEAEGEDEAEDLLEGLETLLHEAETLDPDFADQPLETCLARLRADLNLAAANDLWKSSA